MNTILIGKLLVGCAAGSLVIWLSVRALTDEKVYVYVQTSKTDDIIVSGGDPVDGEHKNYWCQIKDKVSKFDCEITQLKELAENKKYFNNEHFYDSFQDQKSQLKESNNIYRIEMSANVFDWSKDFSQTTIEGVSNMDGKIITTATPLFALNQDGKKLGTTEYFIGKAKTASDNNITIANYECAWKIGGAEPADTNKQSCMVTQFDSSESDPNDTKDHSALTFTNTAATKIEQYKHYLIQFTDTNYPLHTYDQSLIVFYDKTNTSKKVEFSKIKPSFLVDDKLLIVKKQSSSIGTLSQ